MFDPIKRWKMVENVISTLRKRRLPMFMYPLRNAYSKVARNVDDIAGTKPVNPVSMVALTVFTVLYILAELAFNANLLDAVSSNSSYEEIRVIERVGQSLAALGFTILVVRMMGSIFQNKGAMIISAIITFPVFWVLQYNIVHGYFDNRPNEMKANAQHILYLRQAFGSGHLNLYGLDVDWQEDRTPQEKAMMAIFPALVNYSPSMNKTSQEMAPRLFDEYAGRMVRDRARSQHENEYRQWSSVMRELFERYERETSQYRNVRRELEQKARELHTQYMQVFNQAFDAHDDLSRRFMRNNTQVNRLADFLEENATVALNSQARITSLSQVFTPHNTFLENRIGVMTGVPREHIRYSLTRNWYRCSFTDRNDELVRDVKGFYAQQGKTLPNTRQHIHFVAHTDSGRVLHSQIFDPDRDQRRGMTPRNLEQDMVCQLDIRGPAKRQVALNIMNGIAKSITGISGEPGAGRNDRASISQTGPHYEMYRFFTNQIRNQITLDAFNPLMFHPVLDLGGADRRYTSSSYSYASQIGNVGNFELWNGQRDMFVYYVSRELFNNSDEARQMRSKVGAMVMPGLDYAEFIADPYVQMHMRDRLTSMEFVGMFGLKVLNNVKNEPYYFYPMAIPGLSFEQYQSIYADNIKTGVARNVNYRIDNVRDRLLTESKDRRIALSNITVRDEALHVIWIPFIALTLSLFIALMNVASLAGHYVSMKAGFMAGKVTSTGLVMAILFVPMMLTPSYLDFQMYHAISGVEDQGWLVGIMAHWSLVMLPIFYPIGSLIPFPSLS